MAALEIRAGLPADLDRVAAIQAASPEASQWDPPDYLRYDFHVAVADGRLAGFLVSRRVADDETEILNLAVDPEFRRRGIGRALVNTIRNLAPATLYLEVRESNQAARKFYEKLGFQAVALRPHYYQDSPEAAIVMKFHSC